MAATVAGRNGPNMMRWSNKILYLQCQPPGRLLETANAHAVCSMACHLIGITVSLLVVHLYSRQCAAKCERETKTSVEKVNSFPIHSLSRQIWKCMSASKILTPRRRKHAKVHSRVPPSDPLITKGTVFNIHNYMQSTPGIVVGDDPIPESRRRHTAQLCACQPYLSAKPRRPNTEDGTNGTTASATIISATSADVHTGLGYTGRTIQELHGGHRKKEGHFAALPALIFAWRIS